MSRLGDVCDILNGYAFKSENYVEAGIRIIRIANVQKGTIEDNLPVFYPSADIDAQKYGLAENDLLISLTGNVGRVALITKSFLPAALNQRVACLRIKNGVNLDKSYLFNFLNSDFFEQKCIASSKGVAQKNMSTEWLKNYDIPIPNIDKQKKIAFILDEISSLIAEHNKQLLKLDELAKSRFIELFGQVLDEQMVTMEDVCSIITDGTHQPPKFVTEGIPFLFVSNIVTNAITYDAEKFITEETYNELIKRTPIAVGDVLLSTVGSYGHPAVVKASNPFCFQRHIAYLKPRADLVNSVYLHSVILSPDVQRQIEERVKGIAQKTLNLSEIRKLRFPLPTMDKQNEFAAFVEQTNKLKLAVKESLEKLETLKKSLMQKYFG